MYVQHQLFLLRLPWMWRCGTLGGWPAFEGWVDWLPRRSFS